MPRQPEVTSMINVFIALYLFILYELVIIPLILDWSIYGVVLSVAMIVLLIMCIPKKDRLPKTTAGIIFLLSVEAIYNIKSYPVYKLIPGIMIIFFVLIFVGKKLGKTKIRSIFMLFLVALILNASFDLSQARFWPEFTVRWESPDLYQRYATVDYFPIKLADVDNDGVKEIITQENLAEAKKEQLDIIENGKKFQILQPESNNFAIYKWNGPTFKKMPPGSYNMDILTASLPADYMGFPFYETPIEVNSFNGISQQMLPLMNRTQLSEEIMNFGRFPFAILSLDQIALDTRLKNQDILGHPLQSPAIATGDFIPGPPKEQAIIEDNLKVLETAPKPKTIATISVYQVPEIGISEILAGDVDNDSTDELLLTSETSRILKVTKDGKWQVLWSSPEALTDKTRFQHFRFEDFASLGNSQVPEIIALAKSNVRDNPTRYMTGYTYKNGALQQNWRVFSGLINLRAGDVDGDKQNELLGYMYRSQKIFVLKKHNLPLTQLLYGITAGLVLWGFALQFKSRKTAKAGEKNV
jgi:hypothetical protein